MRRWLLLVPVIVLFIVGGIGLFRVRPPAEVGKPPASFTLPLIEGRRPSNTKLTLDDIVGNNPIVLNFWASWCEPCKAEAPAFRRVATTFEGRVTFLGVSILDGPGPAGDFLKNYRIPYDSVVDTRGATAKRFGVTGVPETVFIDARGIVAGAYSGALEEAELERLVEDLLELEPGETLRITGRGETRPVP